MVVKLLLASLPQGLIITDSDRRVVAANEQFCKLFSLNETVDYLITLTGSEVLTLLKDRLIDFDKQLSEIERTAEAREPKYNCEMKLRNGAVLKRDYMPINLKQKHIGNIWLFNDDTENFKARELVKEQKAFYEDILNSIPSDIAVLSPEHKYLFVNPVAVKDAEVRNWLIGKTDFDYCKMKGRSEEVAQSRRAMFNRVIETREQVEWEEKISIGNNEYEYLLRRMKPIFDKNNKVKMVIGYGIEISDIKRIQDQIAISEKRYRDLYNYSQAIICTHDVNGKFLSVNPSFTSILGYSEEEVIGKNISDLLSNAEKEKFYENYLSVILREKKLRGLFKVFTKSGEKAYLLYENYFVEEDVNHPYVIAFAQDVTDRIIIEKKLIEANKQTEETAKAKERFLANMSHEIRTPMSGVIGITELLLKTQLTDEQRKYLEIIDESASNLLNIINSILDLEKVGAGKVELELLPTNMREKFQNIHSFFVHTAEKKNLSLEIENEIPEGLQLLADRTRIGQVFNNLIGNAIKFTKEGKIKLKGFVESETSDSATLHFSIADSGIGIDKAKLNDIFLPFTQAYAETTRLYGGTGLGLAITKNLIELQGGKIWVDSVPGEGSIFHFTVVLQKTKVLNEAATEQEIMFDTDRLKGLKALVVEDNEVNQFLAKSLLEQWGIEVTIASNGSEGIDKVHELDFDLIFMDIQMPVKNGIDATIEIRAMGDERKRNVPIVALTANALKGEEQSYYAAGMNDFLIKPFKEKELLAVLANTLFGQHRPNDNSENENPENGALYNLGMVEDMAKGNEEFVRQLIEVFASAVPATVDELKAALHSNNPQQVGAIAHKLKPTIDTLLISSLQADIRTLEKMGKNNESCEQLRPLVHKVADTLLKVVAQLESRSSIAK